MRGRNGRHPDRRPSVGISQEGASLTCKGLWKVFGSREAAYVEAARGQPTSDLTENRFVDHVAAVRDVSFEVGPGETFVVMGLSGSGKSTLVRCLSRLIEPSAGEIFLDGRPVHALTQPELRELRRESLAMVFQHFGLLPHRTVLTNVEYGLKVRGVDRGERSRRASAAIEVVGLTGWEARYPAQLSGGMRQRVGLARALAVNPRLMLFDEPFSALDPLIRRDLQDELLSLATRVKTTSIFITHDMTEALKLGDRIAIMRDGRLIQVGRPHEILLTPADDYVKRFTQDAPRWRILTAGAAARPAVTVGGETARGEARALAEQQDVSCVFVVDEDGGLAGRVDFDSRQGGDSIGGVVADAMVPSRTVGEGEPLEQAMSMLAADETPIAVVAEGSGSVMSIDRGDVLEALILAAPSDAEQLSVETSESPSERGGAHVR
jgi:glycine betaine/proline transport system ATP-binding protein